MNLSRCSRSTDSAVSAATPVNRSLDEARQAARRDVLTVRRPTSPSSTKGGRRPRQSTLRVRGRESQHSPVATGERHGLRRPKRSDRAVHAAVGCARTASSSPLRAERRHGACKTAADKKAHTEVVDRANGLLTLSADKRNVSRPHDSFPMLSRLLESPYGPGDGGVICLESAPLPDGTYST